MKNNILLKADDSLYDLLRQNCILLGKLVNIMGNADVDPLLEDEATACLMRNKDILSTIDIIECHYEGEEESLVIEI